MKTGFLLFFSILFCTASGWSRNTLPGPATPLRDSFELQSTDDQVRVYVREEEAGEMSVRVVTTAKTDTEAVRRVLDDAEGYPEWVHRCDRAYLLDGGTPEDFVYVSVVNMPFPFRDREVVARVTISEDEAGTLRRTIDSQPGAIPPTPGLDRMEVYRGEWVIRPLKGGLVELQCTVRTNAGAGLPGWLRREILTGGPSTTMANLRRTLESDG